PNGGIIVGGYMRNNTFAKDFLVVRFQNGLYDPSFGLRRISINAGDDEVLGLAVQPDGAIVAVGRTAVGSGTQMAAIRLNADGSQDQSFGSGGPAYAATVPVLLKAEARGVTIDGNGNVLMVGKASSANEDHAVLARLTP